MDSLNDDNFKTEVLEEKNLPVFVDFFATWCGPCQMVGPVIEELANEYKDKIKFVKLDVDIGPKTAQSYNVMSVPTFMIFKNSSVVKQFVGAMTKDGFKEEIDSIL